MVCIQYSNKQRRIHNFIFLTREDLIFRRYCSSKDCAMCIFKIIFLSFLCLFLYFSLSCSHSLFLYLSLLLYTFLYLFPPYLRIYGGFRPRLFEVSLFLSFFPFYVLSYLCIFSFLFYI